MQEKAAQQGKEWTKEDQRKYKELVKGLQQDYNHSQDNWVAFIKKLHTLEYSGDWRCPGITHFKYFLSHVFNGALGYTQYLRESDFILLYGEPFVRRIGTRAAKVLTSREILRYPERKAHMTAFCNSHFKKQGVMPGLQDIYREIRKLVPPDDTKRSAKALLQEVEVERDKLLAENERLKEELKAAQKIINELKAERRKRKASRTVQARA